jgi:hypothetical protein
MRCSVRVSVSLSPSACNSSNTLACWPSGCDRELNLTLGFCGSPLGIFFRFLNHFSLPLKFFCPFPVIRGLCSVLQLICSKT